MGYTFVLCCWAYQQSYNTSKH